MKKTIGKKSSGFGIDQKAFQTNEGAFLVWRRTLQIKKSLKFGVGKIKSLFRNVFITHKQKILVALKRKTKISGRARKFPPSKGGMNESDYFPLLAQHEARKTV
jgi:hypothetical protein